MAITHYVYVLSSETEYYVGLAQDLTIRFDKHKKGYVKSSAKLGNTKYLTKIHHWTLPNYRLASKLERFCHKIQKIHGHQAILDIIRDFPIFTSEHLNGIDQSLPTTYVEQFDSQGDYIKYGKKSKKTKLRKL